MLLFRQSHYQLNRRFVLPKSAEVALGCYSTENSMYLDLSNRNFSANLVDHSWDWPSMYRLRFVALVSILPVVFPILFDLLIIMFRQVSLGLPMSRFPISCSSFSVNYLMLFVSLLSFYRIYAAN